ncbi:MAG TPA: hypothetical protein VEH47_08585 [Candidatus Acidoferrales bacterium]|nr:hypothetical protein [Candidatus Acidoferrales bacterium]
MIAKKAKIFFETFPVYYGQFVILKVESEKKENLLKKARLKARLLRFGGRGGESSDCVRAWRARKQVSRLAGSPQGGDSAAVEMTELGLGE